MRLGGLQPCSLIDFPGALCAIVFTIGCNFRCPYCHNPELVDETAGELSIESFFAFLERRVGLLDGVTITGGEPTMHDDLPDMIARIKEMGFLVKLDTNGTHPAMLRDLITRKLVDYVAMDVKAPLSQYEATVARPVNTDALRQCIDLLREGAVAYEFRTTVVKVLLPPDAIRTIAHDIKGAERYYLQQFIPTKLLNPGFIRKTTYTKEELEALCADVRPFVEYCAVR